MSRAVWATSARKSLPARWTLTVSSYHRLSAPNACRRSPKPTATMASTKAAAVTQKVEITPIGLDRVFFVSGGSEAVESAVKLAGALRVGIPL